MPVHVHGAQLTMNSLLPLSLSLSSGSTPALTSMRCLLNMRTGQAEQGLKGQQLIITKKKTNVYLYTGTGNTVFWALVLFSTYIIIVIFFFTRTFCVIPQKVCELAKGSEIAFTWASEQAWTILQIWAMLLPAFEFIISFHYMQIPHCKKMIFCLISSVTFFFFLPFTGTLHTAYWYLVEKHTSD